MEQQRPETFYDAPFGFIPVIYWPSDGKRVSLGGMGVVVGFTKQDASNFRSGSRLTVAVPTSRRTRDDERYGAPHNDGVKTFDFITIRDGWERMGLALKITDLADTAYLFQFRMHPDLLEELSGLLGARSEARVSELASEATSLRTRLSKANATIRVLNDKIDKMQEELDVARGILPKAQSGSGRKVRV